MAAGGAQIGFLLVLSHAIDLAFTDGANLADLEGSFVAMAVLVALRAGALALGELTAQRCSNALRCELRQELAQRITSGHPRTVGALGEVSGALTEGVEAMGELATKYLPALFSVLSLPLMTAIAIFVLDAPTVLILLFTGPMLVLLLAVIGARTAEVTRRRFEELGWLRGFFLDMVAGLATLKAFGRSGDGAELIGETSRRFGDTTMEVLRTAFQSSLVMEWAATAATALVAVQVSLRMMEGHLSFGTALAVLMLTPEFFVAFRRLSGEYHAGRSADAAADAIAGIAPPTPERTLGAMSAPTAVPPIEPGQPVAPEITLRGVGYTYPGAAHAALSSVDLRIGAAETLALVGASGSGKSTIASLILRFEDPGTGSIAADGMDLATIDAPTWRRNVAWVPQAPTIFKGTVAQNIALGEPGAEPARIAGAAADAGIHEVIDALPHGYDTHLGEGGYSLSAGQRQRMAIARAFLRDAPVVVLDEFTTHLDPALEQAVLDTSLELMAQRSALLIAHHTRTALHADRIAVLDAGRVLECGTHDELMACRGHWYELFTTKDTAP